MPTATASTSEVRVTGPLAPLDAGFQDLADRGWLPILAPASASDGSPEPVAGS
jgi:hypothetical protein